MFLGFGVAALVAVVALVLVKKKGGEVAKVQAMVDDKELAIAQKESEISQKEQQLSQKEQELSQKEEQLSQKDEEIERLSGELTAAVSERDEKAQALSKLEEEFESKMDDVVQSSIQKISHAEKAREEAVQAAQDNYEAAAEVHALLKEKEALINKLQQSA